MARQGLKTLTSNISNYMVKNVETEVLRILTLMAADSLACACGILGLDVPKQRKSNHKISLRYILSQLNSAGVISVSNKNLNWKKRLASKRSAFSEFYLGALDDFVGGSSQKLVIKKDFVIHFEKYGNAFVFNNNSLLDRYGG